MKGEKPWTEREWLQNLEGLSPVRAVPPHPPQSNEGVYSDECPAWPETAKGQPYLQLELLGYWEER
jgi:hypothetical protein